MSRATKAGKCEQCHGGIAPGDEIRWHSRVGTKDFFQHSVCRVPKPDDARQGELIPRRRRLSDLLKPAVSSAHRS